MPAASDPQLTRAQLQLLLLSCGVILLTAAAVLPVNSDSEERILINACPNCITVGDRKLAVQLKVEAIKRQILSKLNLQQRPNISSTLPRELVLEALRKTYSKPLLDGAEPRPDDDASAASTADDYFGKPSEIISFAEPGKSLNGHVLLDFVHPHKNPQRLRVTSATLWIQLRYTSHIPRSVQHLIRDHNITLYIFRVNEDSLNLTEENPFGLELVTSHRLSAARTGWKHIELRDAMQEWFSGPNDKLTLLVDCVGCDSFVELLLFPPTTTSGYHKSGGPDRPLRHQNRKRHSLDTYRPFLVIATETVVQRRARRHAITCNANVSVCCKQTLYVNFKEFGWDDWIIAPKGYYANYCMGDCESRTPDTFAFFHTHVLQEYRKRNPYASITPCCAPTKLNSISLIYFDADKNIIKADLPKMSVDECGCT